MEKSFSIFSLISIGNSDVISQRISDHHPVLHHDALFWNVMMPAKPRKNQVTGEFIGFNNGFGLLEESESDYQERIKKMGLVIAEIIHRNPSIQFIGLCEGPTKPEDLQTLFDSMNRFRSMRRFLTGASETSLHPVKDQGRDNWGLLMLYDHTAFTHAVPEPITPEKALENRFQLWTLSATQAGASRKTFGLAHFPFGRDEDKSTRESLSEKSKAYGEMVSTVLETHADSRLTLCADFNLNPWLLSSAREARAGDEIPVFNSILFLLALAQTRAVTVDGILLSRHEKQRAFEQMPFLHLTHRLKKERSLEALEDGLLKEVF